MARVTVEDCVLKIPNRFELVMTAAQRARQIGSGSALTLPRDNDKNPVVALREIAEDTVNPDVLKEELIRNHQRVVEMDDSEDVIDQQSEAEWSAIAAQSAAAMKFDDIDEDDGDDDEDADSSLEDLAGGAPEADELK